MKKVMQIIPDIGLAGAETMLENLVEAIDKTLYEVSIISFYNMHSAITERIEKLGIKIYYLDKKPGYDIGLYKKIYKILKMEKPDIIHTHRHTLLYTVVPAKLIGKIKMVHTVHNIASKEVPKYSLALQRLFFKYMNVIPVAISKTIRETICKQYNISEEKVPVVLNAINLDKCVGKDNYKNNKTILHIGRFAEQKNHEELIEIFNEISKEYPQCKLRLIGGGELEDKIRNQVEMLNLNNNVEFCGRRSSCHKDISEADVFVLPSKWEGLPMTLIEAMGSGVPTIAYNVGGVSELIENGYSGFVVNNKEEFVEKAKLLLNDEMLREEIGKNAIIASKEFSSKNMAKKYQEIYESGDK